MGWGRGSRRRDPAGQQPCPECPLAAGDLLTLVTPEPSAQPARGHSWGAGVCLQGVVDEGPWRDEGCAWAGRCPQPEGAGVSCPTTILRNRAPARPPTEARPALPLPRLVIITRLYFAYYVL